MFMKLLTEVSLPKYPFRLDHRSPVLMMGSCFTDNIGRLLERYLFPVSINPFGVTYNPLSVKKGLEALMNKEAYGIEDLDQFNNLWFSFDHYTGFSSPDRDQALQEINQSFFSAREVLGQARTLILTWGTSWVYRYKPSGEVVCNCHKIPAGEFNRTRLSTREIIEAYESLLPSLFEFNGDLKIIHTVSPVRHWKDGAHGNQLSKASLLLAGEALQKRFPNQFFYFPSYEIVMDELRDYRYYAEDMIHTSKQATAYIWEKFKEALVNERSGEIINEVESLLKMLEHRPINPSMDSVSKIRHKLQERLDFIKTKHPDLELNNISNRISSYLS
jgi:GSCFA family